MLKNGKCPQCDSSQIVMSQQGVGFDVYVRVRKPGGLDPTSAWTTYLCVACGLFENYVTDGEYLMSVNADPAKQGWERIT